MTDVGWPGEETFYLFIYLLVVNFSTLERHPNYTDMFASGA